MRDLYELDHWRLRTQEVLNQFGSFGDGTCGAFLVPYPKTGATLKVVASCGGGWDHVSVSLPNRCPNWFEMSFIKRTFFKPTETAWEYHPADTEHINIMPNALHMWRKQNFVMIMPPSEFV